MDNLTKSLFLITTRYFESSENAKHSKYITTKSKIIDSTNHLDACFNSVFELVHPDIANELTKITVFNSASFFKVLYNENEYEYVYDGKLRQLQIDNLEKCPLIYFYYNFPDHKLKCQSEESIPPSIPFILAILSEIENDIKKSNSNNSLSEYEICLILHAGDLYGLESFKFANHLNTHRGNANFIKSENIYNYHHDQRDLIGELFLSKPNFFGHITSDHENYLSDWLDLDKRNEKFIKEISKLKNTEAQ